MALRASAMLSLAAGSPATLEEMAQHINSLNLSWTAEVPSKFGDFDDAKQLCGTILPHEEGFVAQAVEKEDDGEQVDIPAEFDVRTNWPDCASVSGNIRDQSACGSCWAFGSTEAFNDRLCIATGSKTLLSTADTAANCNLGQGCFSFGCGGGQPGGAWDWFKSNGVVTGGNYEDIGSGTTCAPYQFLSCAHHVPATAKHPACPSDDFSASSFEACSEDGYATEYSADKVKAASSYSMRGVANIQKDIMQYGSATAAFTVYDDFLTYKSGVYRHTSGKQLGGHAVKMLGWGTEDGQDYWLMANSWNEEWGDSGTFKIVRGENHCGIEGQVSAGLASAVEVTGNNPHYEKPPCQADEAQARVIGTGGVLCAPACDGTTCPSDVPDGVTAQPMCALSDQSGNKYCALLCGSDDECDSEGGASCAQGVCVYTAAASNDGIPMSVMETPTHYEKPPCQADEAQARVIGTGGVLCAPACDGTTCPSDVPDGVTAQPMCALSDQSGNKYCALLCGSDDECDSEGGASCAQGVCVYTAAASNDGIPMSIMETLTHYEKPPCQDDEVQASVVGTGGALCAPACDGTTCPSDMPDGVTAQPLCFLSDQSGNKYCGLLCESDDQCDTQGGANCAKPHQGAPGVCVYAAASNGIPMFMETPIIV